MIRVSRAEVCAVACAELFRGAGEIMVSPMTTMASIGARLARLTFAPEILLTDGEARLLADTPSLGAAGAIEGWMPLGYVARSWNVPRDVLRTAAGLGPEDTTRRNLDLIAQDRHVPLPQLIATIESAIAGWRAENPHD